MDADAFEASFARRRIRPTMYRPDPLPARAGLDRLREGVANRPREPVIRIHGGRISIRCMLYMATLSAIRCNPVIKAHYTQLRARGKLFKVAMVACMRKLLVILSAMARSKTAWNPEFTAAA